MYHYGVEQGLFKESAICGLKNAAEIISKEEQFLMADAQTSGGLLISVPRDKAETLQNSLQENNCLASSMIGEIYNPDEVSIYVN